MGLFRKQFLVHRGDIPGYCPYYQRQYLHEAGAAKTLSLHEGWCADSTHGPPAKKVNQSSLLGVDREGLKKKKVTITKRYRCTAEMMQFLKFPGPSKISNIDRFVTQSEKNSNHNGPHTIISALFVHGLRNDMI